MTTLVVKSMMFFPSLATPLRAMQVYEPRSAVRMLLILQDTRVMRKSLVRTNSISLILVAINLPEFRSVIEDTDPVWYLDVSVTLIPDNLRRGGAASLKYI